VLNVANDGLEVDAREQFTYLVLQVEECGFGNLEANNGFGIEACDLSAELGADGAGCPGDQDDLILNFSPDQVRIESRGGAAEQIFHSYVSNLSGKPASMDNFR